MLSNVAKKDAGLISIINILKNLMKSISTSNLSATVLLREYKITGEDRADDSFNI